MHLKQVEISGFKSFASRTVFDFLPPENGKHSVTAVVGPNGSGKSNVADAIKWVMGEQRLSKLRVKKSGDLIFSGSSSKGKRGLASVSLYLDNAKEVTGLDYDELVITRKLHADGESEYLINSSPVRLYDLQLLLAKAKFGQGSYSVVGQGVVDRMLLQTPAERKDFFDEAAGIKEFQIKRHQASLKLTRTIENIKQAQLLLNEIAPQLKSLTRQVKKLEKRQEVEGKLRALQDSYYTCLWNHNKQQADILNKEVEELEKDYLSKSGELDKIQTELAQLARAQTRAQAFDEMQLEYKKILQEKNNLEKLRAQLQGRMQVEYSKIGKQNVSWLENKIDEIGTQLKDAKQLQSKHELEQKKVLERNNELQKQLELETVKKVELVGQIDKLKRQIGSLKNDAPVGSFGALQTIGAILSQRHAIDGIYGLVAQLGSVSEKYRIALDVSAGGHLSSLVVKNDQVAGQCIDYLRSNHLGVATFLPINKIKPRLPFHDIDKILGYDGVLGLAIDLVDYDNKFNDIFSYVLGGTVIIEDREVAGLIGIGRVRMVTLDGDVFERSGSIKGGFRSKKRQAISFASGVRNWADDGGLEKMKSELADKEKELDLIQEKLIDLDKQIRETQSSGQLTDVHLQSTNEKATSLEGELSGLEQELKLINMDPKQFDKVMEEIVRQKEKVDDDINKVSEKLNSIEKQISKFNDEEEQKKQKVFALQDEQQTRQLHLNELISQKNQKQIDLARYQTKLENLSAEVYQEMSTTIESILKRQIEFLDSSQLEEAQVKISKYKYKLTLIGGIDDEVLEEHTEIKKRHDDLQNQLKDLSEAVEDLQKMIKKLDEVAKSKRSQAFEKIRKEFKKYFKILFDGGRADLIEVYENKSDLSEQAGEENELEEGEKKINSKRKGEKLLTGIEVIANPPGKKIKHLPALSGGERTLTALALISAILNTNPSPFVVLDEVEAALDEANSLRFSQILKDLADKSQFILITHNRTTMHASDALYGVTMGGDGMSRLLSVKLET